MNRRAFLRRFPISEEERIRRTGEIICRGIMASPSLWSGPEKIPVVPSQPARAFRVPVTGEEQVLHYPGSVPAASPKEIRVFVKMSRATLYRVLHRLVLAGRVVGSGRTRNAGYRLAGTEIGPLRN
ncbi:hypothetical protein OpiT1DRAFT_03805 [Opitutaceae bacterium TAV1]|nr:hypothetical protein OpiT1DRAFT_03805 [Opitutaceae bacterium TAV1]